MLTVRQWIDINSVAKESVFDKMILTICILKNKDISEVAEFSPKKIIQDYKEIIQSVKISESNKSKINLAEKELQLINFERLTFGQFIDLEELINENFTLNFDKIVATIYLEHTRGNFQESKIEKYEKINIAYRSELIGELPINDVYGAVKKYEKFRSWIFESFEIFKNPFEDVKVDELTDEEAEIYKKEKKEIEKTNENKWLEILNYLSNNDVTKFKKLLNENLFLILNQLTWLKSKN